MSEAAEWFVYLESGQQGPYAATALRNMLGAGHIGPDHQVWKDGLAGWVRLGDVAELVSASAPVAADFSTTAGFATRPAATGSGIPAFVADRLLFRRKVFKLFGNAFHVYTPDGALVLYGKQKAFKLKEDIRVFADEAQAQELLSIKARSIIDFSAAYDVHDATTGEKVGAYRRKGLRSILRDKWEILDTMDTIVGTIEEDSMYMALLRRLLSNLIPQSYTVTVNGVPSAHLKQRFNPFVFKADYVVQGGGDRRLLLAGIVLLMCIEGRQG